MKGAIHIFPTAFQMKVVGYKAGKYIIRMLDDSDLGVVEITSADGTASTLFEVRQAQAKSSPQKSELIFNKYGNSYFLTSLFDEGEPEGTQVVGSRYEKRFAQSAADGQEHVPARSRKRRQASRN